MNDTFSLPVSNSQNPSPQYITIQDLSGKTYGFHIDSKMQTVEDFLREISSWISTPVDALRYFHQGVEIRQKGPLTI